MSIYHDNAMSIHHDNHVSFCHFRTERSTDQVIKPVNLEALSKWVGAIPEDVKKDMRTVAPMLERLGYNPQGYPPNYGDADKFVMDNTIHIKNNEDLWRKKSQDVINMSKPPRHITKNVAAPHGPISYGKDAVNKQETYGKDFEDAKQIEKEGDKSDSNGQKVVENR